MFRFSRSSKHLNWIYKNFDLKQHLNVFSERLRSSPSASPMGVSTYKNYRKIKENRNMHGGHARIYWLLFDNYLLIELTNIYLRLMLDFRDEENRDFSFSSFEFHKWNICLMFVDLTIYNSSKIRILNVFVSKGFRINFQKKSNILLEADLSTQ